MRRSIRSGRPALPKIEFPDPQIIGVEPEIYMTQKEPDDLLRYKKWLERRNAHGLPTIDNHETRDAYARFNKHMSERKSPPKLKAPPISEKAARLLRYFIDPYTYRHNSAYIELCQYIAQLEEGF